MEKHIQVFNNTEFGEIRTMEINGEPWFVGKDVATALGYSNPRDAMFRHVDSEDKNTVAFHDGNKGNPNQTIINESGMYSLRKQSKANLSKRDCLPQRFGGNRSAETLFLNVSRSKRQTHIWNAFTP